MRSFLGRDIQTLKVFSREDFFRVFEVANDLRPHARDRRNGDLLRHKTLTAHREMGCPDWLHTPKAKAEIVKLWKAMAPLVDWLDTWVGPPHV